MGLQLDINEEKNKERLGRVIDVLVEDYDPVSEAFFGRSAADAPEIDGKVYFRAKRDAAQSGDIVKVKITEVCDYDLVGELAK